MITVYIAVFVSDQRRFLKKSLAKLKQKNQKTPLANRKAISTYVAKTEEDMQIEDRK